MISTHYLIYSCLDSLIKKLDELQQTADLYSGLIDHTRNVLRAVYELAHIHRNFGDAFANIGAREPQKNASEAFTKFGDAHRQTDRYAMALFQTVRPVHIQMSRYIYIYM
jgi:hypothetical protein